jgi:hypothetical protein
MRARQKRFCIFKLHSMFVFIQANRQGKMGDDVPCLGINKFIISFCAHNFGKLCIKSRISLIIIDAFFLDNVRP